MNPIVIIGAGLAGWNTARELRKLDPAIPLVLLAADGGDFYSKPMLSNALAQGKSAAQLVNSPANLIAGQLDVVLHTDLRVIGIDRAAKLIRTQAGEHPYEKLVLALGADPIRLSLAGSGAADVMSVNDIGDYARFRAAITDKKHIAIIGAGLIGCEFANDLATAGLKVSVIDPTAWPLSSLLPETAGRSLIEPLAKAGVGWRFGRSVTSVDHAAQGYLLALDDGSAIAADAVLSAVGLRPRIFLAKGAGIAVNRGIIVDAQLRSSDPDIFALGDCAEIEAQLRPYVMPIMHAARALANTLSGTPTAVAFPPMPVLVKTPACPAAIQPVGRDAAGKWQIVHQDANGVKALFHSPDGRLTGFALTGRWSDERAALTKLLAN